MNIPFRKCCKFCHARLKATLVDLLPKVVGLPQVECSRCGRTTKLSLLVTVASLAAGACIGAGSVLVCNAALSGTIATMPLGAAAILVPIGIATGLAGYIAFAACCYVIHFNWMLLSGAE